MKYLITILFFIPVFCFAQTGNPIQQIQVKNLKDTFATRMNLKDSGVKYVSPFGIKTVNGNTLVGNGDVVISGAGGIDTTKQTQSYIIGNILNQNSWASTTGWVANGYTPTVTANKLVFTGSGTFTNSYDYNYVTDLEKILIGVREIVPTKTSNSYGVGLGLKSTNVGSGQSVFAVLDLSTGANAGKVLIYTNSGNLVATSTLALTITAGDSVHLTLERNYDLITATATNITTKALPVSVTYNYKLTYTATYVMPTVTRFSLINYGNAATTIDSVWMSSKSLRNLDLLLVGDSKFVGYYSGTPWARAGEILKQYFNVDVNAGGGETVDDCINKIAELVAINAKTYIINIGRNNIGVMNADTLNKRIDTIDARLQRLLPNSLILWQYPLYETAVDQSNMAAHIVSAFGNRVVYNKLRDYSGTSSNILLPDNIHLNSFGNQIVADGIVQSGKVLRYAPFNAIPFSLHQNPNFPIQDFGSQYQGTAVSPLTQVGIGPNSTEGLYFTYYKTGNLYQLSTVAPGVAWRNMEFDANSFSWQLPGNGIVDAFKITSGGLAGKGFFTTTGDIGTTNAAGSTGLYAKNTGNTSSTYSYIRLNSQSASTSTYDGELKLTSPLYSGGVVGSDPYLLNSYVWRAGTSLNGLILSAEGSSGTIKFNLGSAIYGAMKHVMFSNGDVTINDTLDANSTFKINGSLATKYTSTATSITLDKNYYDVEVTATGQTITLPTAVGIAGRHYHILLSASGTCTIATTSGQYIGVGTNTTYSLSAAGKSIMVYSNNVQWNIESNN